MRRLVSVAALAAATTLAGCDSPTTYIERSLNHTDTLIVEHPPVPRAAYSRREGQAAIAGYCREGGLIRRRDEAGNPVIIRQREICDSVAPFTLDPGEVYPRPTWKAPSGSEQTTLRSKG